MKTATIIQHVSFEDLGSLRSVLRSRGFELRELLAGRDSLAAHGLGEPDLVVVLGGPISVNDTRIYPFLRDELQFLERRSRQQQPCIGICLGAQLMSKALGGSVTPMAHKEIGWSPLDLHPEVASGGASGSFPLAALRGHPVLHWHGEQFSVPPGATSLASTPLCANQAFALGNYALGLQFHPEVTQQGLELWYVAHCAELGYAGIDILRLRAEAEKYCSGLEERAGAMFTSWLEACGL